MIYVKTVPEEVGQEWLDKAARLTGELSACEDDGEDVPEDQRKTARQKRKEIMERNGEHWSRLKPILLRWSHQKCWYSELRDDGSDYHVDHFRPKGRVRNPGESDREGYWWLAFDWTNYRVAVGWCNAPHRGDGTAAKGKHDQFPLAAGSAIASRPADDISAEKPVLLDPTNEEDVLLVDFNEEGLPIPSVDGWGAQRVLRTRDVLHLDAPRMVEARKRVWRDCGHAVLQAHDLINIDEASHRLRDDAQLRAWIETICRMIRPDAPLSAVARAYLVKCEYVWARRLLYDPRARIPA